MKDLAIHAKGHLQDLSRAQNQFANQVLLLGLSWAGGGNDHSQTIFCKISIWIYFSFHVFSFLFSLFIFID